MQITDLTPDEQAALAADERLIRSVFVELVGAMRKAKAVQAAGTARTRAILTQLDPGTVIPNTTALAGAGPIYREELVALLDGVDAVLADHYDFPSSLPLYAKLIGPVNLANPVPVV